MLKQYNRNQGTEAMGQEEEVKSFFFFFFFLFIGKVKSKMRIRVAEFLEKLPAVPAKGWQRRRSEVISLGGLS